MIQGGQLLKRSFIIAAGLLVASLTAGPSFAQEHAKGLFLRGTGGLNNGSSKINDDSVNSGTNQLSGMGLDYSAAVGWALAQNFAVHVTGFGWRVSDPAIGRNQGNLDGGTFSMMGLGLGATLYMMPTNMYFSLTLGAGKLNLDDGSTSQDSGKGFAMMFTVGKEWFLAPKFGLGPALSLSYHSIPDYNVEHNWNGTRLAASVSATFN